MCVLVLGDLRSEARDLGAGAVERADRLVALGVPLRRAQQPRRRVRGCGRRARRGASSRARAASSCSRSRAAVISPKLNAACASCSCTDASCRRASSSSAANVVAVALHLGELRLEALGVAAYGLELAGRGLAVGDECRLVALLVRHDRFEIARRARGACELCRDGVVGRDSLGDLAFEHLDVRSAAAVISAARSFRLRSSSSFCCCRSLARCSSRSVSWESSSALRCSSSRSSSATRLVNAARVASYSRARACASASSVSSS